MFIYITGDCHGDYRRFSTEIFPEQYTMGKNDYVIVCGDFGYWSEDREQCNLRRPAATDAELSGRSAEPNGHPC